MKDKNYFCIKLHQIDFFGNKKIKKKRNFLINNSKKNAFNFT